MDKIKALNFYYELKNIKLEELTEEDFLEILKDYYKKRAIKKNEMD